MTSFDEYRSRSLKPNEAEEALAQLQINSINPDDGLGGDRHRDPGFFTFFPTDKEAEKEKNNKEDDTTN